MWGAVAAAGLSIVLIPLTFNFCFLLRSKVKAKLTGAKGADSALQLLVWTLVTAGGWALLLHPVSGVERGQKWGDQGLVYLARGPGLWCGNLFASGAHTYTYSDPKFYYQQKTDDEDLRAK